MWFCIVYCALRILCLRASPSVTPAVTYCVLRIVSEPLLYSCSLTLPTWSTRGWVRSENNCRFFSDPDAVPRQRRGRPSTPPGPVPSPDADHAPGDGENRTQIAQELLAQCGTASTTTLRKLCANARLSRLLVSCTMNQLVSSRVRRFLDLVQPAAQTCS